MHDFSADLAGRQSLPVWAAGPLRVVLAKAVKLEPVPSSRHSRKHGRWAADSALGKQGAGGPGPLPDNPLLARRTDGDYVHDLEVRPKRSRKQRKLALLAELYAQGIALPVEKPAGERSTPEDSTRRPSP